MDICCSSNKNDFHGNSYLIGNNRIVMKARDKKHFGTYGKRTWYIAGMRFFGIYFAWICYYF